MSSIRARPGSTPPAAVFAIVWTSTRGLPRRRRPVRFALPQQIGHKLLIFCTPVGQHIELAAPAAGGWACNTDPTQAPGTHV